MKIIKTMKFEISFEEIAKAMKEQINGTADIAECISYCTEFLAAIPLAKIMEMPKEQRAKIGDELLGSSGRFHISDREYVAITTGYIS